PAPLSNQTPQSGLAPKTLEAALANCQRIKSGLDDPKSLSGLARSCNDLGALLQESGRLEEAAKYHREALTLRKRLAEGHPEVVQYAINLAGSHCNLGNALALPPDDLAAVASYGCAVDGLRAVLQKAPGQRLAKEFLRNSLAARGSCLKQLGRFAEALRDYDEALAADDGALRRPLLAARAATLAHLGDHEQALKEFWA